jgi:hypothetical protein
METMVSDLLAFSQLEYQEGGGAISVHLDGDLKAAVTLLQASVEQSGGTITHDPLPNINIDETRWYGCFRTYLGIP